MSVYFIRVGRYFKIGASDNPERRCDRLHKSGTRYTFPTDAPLGAEGRELYKVIDGWKDVEAGIHLALDDFSVGLEWFLDEPPLRDFIDALPTSGREQFPKVERVGGWCADEYERVQHGRAEREIARFQQRRAS